jgi:hypothetical protein
VRNADGWRLSANIGNANGIVRQPVHTGFMPALRKPGKQYFGISAMQNVIIAQGCASREREW